MGTVSSARDRAQKYSQSDIDLVIRSKIRKENIRDDTSFMQRMRWEIWLSNLSWRAKLVGMAVWEHADTDGKHAFPGMARLHAMVGGSKRDLTSALREFSEWEFITTAPSAGRRATEFIFRIPEQTLSELSQMSDGVVVPLRRNQGNVCGTTVVPQNDEDRCGTTVVPQTPCDTAVVPQEGVPDACCGTVVVPSHAVVVPSHIKNARVDLIDLKKDNGTASPQGRSEHALTAAKGAAVGAVMILGEMTGLAAEPASPLQFEGPPAVTQPAKRQASRLSPDWQLSRRLGQWAMHNCKRDEAWVRRQAEKFKAHWLSAPDSEGFKKNWDATWHRWCERALQYEAKFNNGRPFTDRFAKPKPEPAITGNLDGFVRPSWEKDDV